jgi:hypothetical protein
VDAIPFRGNVHRDNNKSKKQKVVLFLSTLHDKHVIPNQQENTKKKPEVTLFYNQTKGGVDKADEMLRQYSCTAGSRRWPLACFFNIIDIACLNAYVISKEANICNASRRNFQISLAQSPISSVPLLLPRVLQNVPHLPGYSKAFNASFHRLLQRLQTTMRIFSNEQNVACAKPTRQAKCVPLAKVMFVEHVQNHYA